MSRRHCGGTWGRRRVSCGVGCFRPLRPPRSLAEQWETLPATQPHPLLGGRHWINTLVSIHGSTLHHYPTFPELHGTPFTAAGVHYIYTTKFGDGADIPHDVISEIRGAAAAPP